MCLGLLASCCGGMTCCLCGDCKEIAKIKTGPMSRIPYLFLFLLLGAFSIFMSLYGGKTWDLKLTSITVCSTESCQGNGAVYRTSFVLFLFELIHVLIIGFGVVQFHYYFFAIKMMCAIVAVIITMFANSESSNEFFETWKKAARVFSGFYILVQLLILISLSYETNDYLVSKADNYYDDEENNEEDGKTPAPSGPCNFWVPFLIVFSIALHTLGYIFIGLFFSWYGKEGCDGHTGLIVAVLILNVLTLIGSVAFGINGNGGNFLVAGIVNLYITFLLFGGLQADTDETCNEFSRGKNNASLWIGIFVTFFTLLYAACRANQLGLLCTSDSNAYNQDLDDDEEQNNNNNDAENKPNEKPLLSDTDKLNETDKKLVQEDQDVSNYGSDEQSKNKGFLAATKNLSARKSETFFHIILTLASCYYAMIFTNWGDVPNNAASTNGKNSMYVNVISLFICYILFWWTMLAPCICPSRFGIVKE